MSKPLNVANRLTKIAELYPNSIAIAESNGRQMTFAELEADTNRIAAALLEQGAEPGMKLALFVHYGIDFLLLVFALCKAGIVIVLIDPGMGIKRMLNCLAEVEPDGFVAVPVVHFVRWFYSKKFPKAKFNFSAKRLLAAKLVPQTKTEALPVTKADDLAAIIFTSGSTGPAKGVAFTHLNFDTQVSEIQKRYNIQPGEIDLACFPFFGLFDCLMGVTTVIPDMNTSKPATANPAKLLEQANRRKITQSFASPAVWNKVADYCLQTGKRFETLKRAVSAGAPVSDKILKKLSKVLPVGADIFTPYGATESLPVASISYRERTAARSENKGNIGVCVGKRFDTIQWKIIKITDEPITHLESDNTNFIGELCVSGPQVTKEYVNRPEANAVSKITDKDGNVWHRIGDTGYIDEQDRFWFCGRKAHRVETPDGTLFSIPCEAVFNQHPNVYRSALAKQQSAASARIFIEPYIFPNTPKERDKLLAELRQLASANPLTKTVSDIRILKSFPVDVRHNIKINRELLSTLR